MSNILLISTLRAVSRVQARCLHTSPTCLKMLQLTQEQKDKQYPIVGNRDIVGHGHSGEPDYMDRNDFPCPAVRWKPNTPEVMALREKEKGDWKNLTMEDKKSLYRASFRQTFAELNAPSGDWKFHVAACLMCMIVTGWMMVWMEVCGKIIIDLDKEYKMRKVPIIAKHVIIESPRQVYPPLPETFTKEKQEYYVERMIKQGVGPISGISSKYDFDNKKWK